ncbi:MULTISPECIES: hypothetical protein [Cupriavidus]|jgi:hypothetical protein|nr:MULTISPECIES: hypothetical protein [Cupriavidus]ESJ21459.1 hypothetical protein B551_0208595 [Cupriavidus sp. HPC(L)]MCD9121109.1 hypothetical protein [Cupriavidus sp. UGS-1]MCT9074467.1 hypothetical protein [Cupriavidus gilardii]QKS63584.1 hypothetical protein FOB47_16975 [Cupriavidus gilardii]UXC34585.1 hypothetical protein N4G38_08935 [Cupriavidus gilardii]
MSRVVAILLMLLLPLQAMAAVDRQFAHASEAMLEHMVAHAEHVPHHHDEDGAMHEDDSTASASHQLDFDFASGLYGTVGLAFSVPLVPPRYLTPSFLPGPIPSPFSSPPLRPPHAAA